MRLRTPGVLGLVGFDEILMRAQNPHCDQTSLVIIFQLAEVLPRCHFALCSHLLLWKNEC